MKLTFPYPSLISIMDRYYHVTKSYGSASTKKKSERLPPLSPPQPKRKLSILVATFWDYPHTGGLSNYITSLCEGLRQQGHHVDVISPNQFSSTEVSAYRKRIIPKLKDFFIKRYGTTDSLILKNNRNMYVYEKMLEKMDLSKYDVFHAQDLFTANILGRFNEHYNRPLFFTPHGMYTFNRLKFGIFKSGSLEEVYYRTLEEQAIQYSDQLIILSHTFRKPLMELGARPEQMITVYTGIDAPTHFKRQKEAHEPLVVTCVARLGPRKGHDILFQALAKLDPSLTKQLTVLIAGDGERKEMLHKQIQKLNLPYVKMLGNRDDVPTLLQATDVFVLPTLNDSLPIAIIEAMHSGAAIISTNVGGIPELVLHKKTGLIVEPNDVDQLAHALRLLLSNHAARKTLSRHAKEYAQARFTKQGMIASIEKLYHHHLNKRASYAS
ncbi:glycosyl transferase, group 1 family protein [Fictibacillus macauensis ZFHKF-1]|uniref:Glycosyl transferase, group 1 family protein n=2 Tax=Fictibacillus TaxID=1329200 RepID=I8UH40_9BACL|nr:glycosyl transferase, group 1 family protein [Fictibacillus macauensis ZFHKF-1]